MIEKNQFLVGGILYIFTVCNIYKHYVSKLFMLQRRLSWKQIWSVMKWVLMNDLYIFPQY